MRKENLQNTINELYDLFVHEASMAFVEDKIEMLRMYTLEASETLVKWLYSKEESKRDFAYTVLSDLGDKRILPKLEELVYDSEVMDETRLITASLISMLGGSVDERSLMENIDDVDYLTRRTMEYLLENANNPMFVSMFIDNFEDMPLQIQYSVLNDLSSHENIEEIIDLIAPLAERSDDNIRRLIVGILIESQTKKAIPYLQNIIQITKDKDVEKIARKGIFKLSSLKVSGDLNPPSIEKNRFYKAYATSTDGVGSSIIVFSAEDESGNIRFINVVCNEELGIKDSMGGDISIRDFMEMIEDILMQDAFIVAEVSADYSISKLKTMEFLTRQANTPLPNDYLAWKKILDCNIEKDPRKVMDKKYNNFLETKNEKELEELMDLTGELVYDCTEFDSWIFSYESFEQELFDLENKTGQKYDMGFNLLVNKMIRKYATNDFLKTIKQRLDEYAYISFMSGDKDFSELALSASHTLFTCPPEEHPFIIGLASNSLEAYTMGDDLQGLSPFQIPSFSPDFEGSPIEFPEDATELDKLYTIKDHFPEMKFARDFPEDISDLKDLEKIQFYYHLNTEFRSFIEQFTELDWHQLHKECAPKCPPHLKSKQLMAIEQQFLSTMQDKGYVKDHLEYSKQLWWDFVFIVNGEVKPMRKPESWASGVEYLVGRLFYDNDSQQEVANSYGISKASLTKRYQEIQEVLNITLYYSPWQQSFSVLGDALRNYLGMDSSLLDGFDDDFIDDDEWDEF